MENEAWLNSAFFKLLQCDVMMTIGSRKYRAGRLQNFKVQEIFIQVELLINGKLRTVELPLPFKMTATDDTISFSYKMSDMGVYGDALNRKIKKQFGNSQSKLYNNVLTIKRN